MEGIELGERPCIHLPHLIGHLDYSPIQFTQKSRSDDFGVIVYVNSCFIAALADFWITSRA